MLAAIKWHPLFSEIKTLSSNVFFFSSEFLGFAELGNATLNGVLIGGAVALLNFYFVFY